MLHPSVVDPVKATCSAGVPRSAANEPRSSSRFASTSLEVRVARPPLLELPALDGLHGLDGRARKRAERARVQVRVALEHRQAAADGYEVDAITASTGAWSERTAPFTRRRSSAHGSGPRSQLEAAGENLVDPLDRLREARHRVVLDVEIAEENAPLRTREEGRGTLDLLCDPALVGVVRSVQVGQDNPLTARLDLEGVAHAPLATAEEPVLPRQPGIEDEAPVLSNLEMRVDEQRVRLAGEARAEALGVAVGHAPREGPEKRRHRLGPGRLHAAPAFQPRHRPERYLLQRDDVGRVRGHEPHHLLEAECRRRGVRPPVVEVPAADEKAQLAD